MHVDDDAVGMAGGGPALRAIVMFVTVELPDIRQIGLTGNPRESVMTKHVERELTNQMTELTADEMESVSGGSLVPGHDAQIAAHFHPLTSPGTSWYRFPGKKKP